MSHITEPVNFEHQQFDSRSKPKSLEPATRTQLEGQPREIPPCKVTKSPPLATESPAYGQPSCYDERVDPQIQLEESMHHFEELVAVNEDKNDDDVDSNDESALWQPTWLQPIVLSCFTGIFLGLGIALLVISCISKTNHGILRTQERFGYIWRFGPTTG